LVWVQYLPFPSEDLAYHLKMVGDDAKTSSQLCKEKHNSI